MADSSVATDETQRLIASNKVEGTAVYDRDGEKLGSVYNFMVDKRSGKVEYAVLASGGLFGLGADYYPLPWETLDYDVSRGGYVVSVDRDQLSKGPSYGRDAEPAYDADYDRQVYGHYGLTLPY